MDRIRGRRVRAALLGSLAVAMPVGASADDDLPTGDARVHLGQRVYAKHCVGCHGVDGDGQGPAAAMLLTQPRDFRPGVFKFRSTPNGELPTDQDLYRTITRGVHRTSMPSFTLLSELERLAVIDYLKTFSEAWERRGPGTPISLPRPPDWLGSLESVQRGRELYAMLGCGSCHGDTGRGDGDSASTLPADTWGHPQKPFNFTRGGLKSGPTVSDVYRTFMTGLNGTAMPSYGDIFDRPDGVNILEGDAWNLVSYVLALREPPSTPSTPSRP